MPPPARGTKNPSTGGIFACLRAGRSLRVPFPNHHFNKNIPPFGRIFLLERVMGLSAHFAAWLGSALPARALHSLPGAGKGVTGAFPYPPFESPQFQFQQKYPPIREDISVGASGDTAFFKKHSNINGFRTPEQRNYLYSALLKQSISAAIARFIFR